MKLHVHKTFKWMIMDDNNQLFCMLACHKNAGKYAERLVERWNSFKSKKKKVSE